jgi:hypothetical protein
MGAWEMVGRHVAAKIEAAYRTSNAASVATVPGRPASILHSAIAY